MRQGKHWSSAPKDENLIDISSFHRANILRGLLVSFCSTDAPYRRGNNRQQRTFAERYLSLVISSRSKTGLLMA